MMRTLSTILLLSLVVHPVVAFPQESQPINKDLLTGLWSARWITHPTAPTREYGVYHLRKGFTLSERPDRFIVHVSADNRYRLFVNGQPASEGPARGDLEHWRFETLDIAPLLAAGNNTLACVIWNFGERAATNQFTHQAAFILQGDTDKEAVANTGGTWKVIQDLAYSPSVTGWQMTGPQDIVDGTKVPWGWQEKDFDDSRWLRPRLLARGTPRGIGSGTFWALVPRTLPSMESRMERLTQIRRAEGVQFTDPFLEGRSPLVVPANTRATILLDQSHLTNAYPELIVSGGEGSQISLTYAEGLVDEKNNKGNRNEIEGRHMVGLRDVFLPDGGERRLFRPLWFRTYRYVEMKIETRDKPVTVLDLYGMFTGYPFEAKATFLSDDPMLARIWETGWRTARLCAGETYYDCPYYEQLQYVGDTRIQALISLYVAGDDRLVRNAISQIDDSRLPAGLTQSRYPSNEQQIIPPFSLFWIAMVHDYWMHRDDRAFVGTFRTGIHDVLDFFEKRLDSSGWLGHVPWWNFVDWPNEWPWSDARSVGGVPPGGETGESSILSLELAYALELAAELSGAYDDQAEAAQYRELAAGLKAATMVKCWDAGRGLIADTPAKKEFSQHASLLGVLTDAIPGARQREVMERIASDKSLTQCTLYFRFYLSRAMTKVGLADRYVEMLGPWREMIDLGLTTFAERPEPTRSDCHAWSASPNCDLLATVAGIEPGSPGFKTVRIAPHLGPLKWIKASMPHPQGMLSVDLKREGRTGLRGQVELPPGLAGQFTWNTVSVPLRAGIQQIAMGEP